MAKEIADNFATRLSVFVGVAVLAAVTTDWAAHLAGAGSDPVAGGSAGPEGHICLYDGGACNYQCVVKHGFYWKSQPWYDDNCIGNTCSVADCVYERYTAPPCDLPNFPYDTGVLWNLPYCAW